jgi:hypothetical protein
MNPNPATQEQQALVKVTQGRRGMLLTDSFVLTRPVVFDLAPPDAARRREGADHPAGATEPEPLR